MLSNNSILCKHQSILSWNIFDKHFALYLDNLKMPYSKVVAFYPFFQVSRSAILCKYNIRQLKLCG